MSFIDELKPTLNVQCDSIRAKDFNKSFFPHASYCSFIIHLFTFLFLFTYIFTILVELKILSFSMQS